MYFFIYLFLCFRANYLFSFASNSTLTHFHALNIFVVFTCVSFQDASSWARIELNNFLSKDGWLQAWPLDHINATDRSLLADRRSCVFFFRRRLWLMSENGQKPNFSSADSGEIWEGDALQSSPANWLRPDI